MTWYLIRYHISLSNYYLPSHKYTINSRISCKGMDKILVETFIFNSTIIIILDLPWPLLHMDCCHSAFYEQPDLCDKKGHDVSLLPALHNKAMHCFGPNDAATRLTIIGNNGNYIGSQSLMCFSKLVFDVFTISVASVLQRHTKQYKHVICDLSNVVDYY